MVESNREFDVFVSYSTNDHEWVGRYLIPMLRSWGLEVAIDSQVFEKGRCLNNQIETLLRSSKKVVFVCTKHSRSSEWCRMEVKLVTDRGNDIDDHKSLVFELERDEVPSQLRKLNRAWCRFAEKQDNETEWRNFCSAVGGTWSEESDRVLNDLRDLASFFGGFMNNRTDTYVVVRGHNMRTTEWEEPAEFDHALPADQLHAVGPAFIVLGRVGKVENVLAIMENDLGDQCKVRDGRLANLSDETANFVCLGDSSIAEGLLKKTGNFEYCPGPWDENLEVHRNTSLEFEGGRTYTFDWDWTGDSYLIYKSATRVGGGNLIWMTSPSGGGVKDAAQSFLKEYWTLARLVGEREVIMVYRRQDYLVEILYPRENLVRHYKYDPMAPTSGFLSTVEHEGKIFPDEGQ